MNLWTENKSLKSFSQENQLQAPLLISELKTSPWNHLVKKTNYGIMGQYTSPIW